MRQIGRIKKSWAIARSIFFAFLGFIHAHIFTVYGSMHDFLLEKNIDHVCKDDISTK